MAATDTFVMEDSLYRRNIIILWFWSCKYLYYYLFNVHHCVWNLYGRKSSRFIVVCKSFILLTINYINMGTYKIVDLNYLLTYLSLSFHEEHRPSTTTRHRVLFCTAPTASCHDMLMYSAARSFLDAQSSSSLGGSIAGLGVWYWKVVSSECDQSSATSPVWSARPEAFVQLSSTGHYWWSFLTILYWKCALDMCCGRFEASAWMLLLFSVSQINTTTQTWRWS